MSTRIVTKKGNCLRFVYIALIGMCAMVVSCIANANTFSVTSNAVENAGTTLGDLANCINSANVAPNNEIVFNIDAAVNYNAGPMPAITNLPMTIVGNNKAALRLRTAPATTPLFNVTGAINPGILTLTNMLSGLPILQSDTNVDLGNTLEFKQENTGTYGTNASNISGQGAVRLTLSNVGTTVTFTTANTYEGGTTFTSGGTFVAGNNSALGVGGIDFGTGTIQSNATRTLANPFTISAPASLGGVNNLTLSGTVNLNANTLTSTNTLATTLSNVVSGAGGKIEVNALGVGALVLSGVNTYTGGTFLTAGTVRVENAAALGTGKVFMNGGILRSGVTITIPNNYELGADSFIGGTNNLTITGTGDLGTSNLTITNTATTTLTGTISDTSLTGSITISAVTGDVELSTANTYGGGTTLAIGNLHIGNSNALGSALGISEGRLTMSGGALQATVALTNPIPNKFTVTAPSTLNGNRSFTMGGQGVLGSTLAVANTGTSVITLAGNISGVGSIAKSAGGTLAITSTNSYAGGTTLTAGTLSLGNNDALGGVGGGTLSMGGGSLQASTTLNNIPNAFTLTAPSTMNGSNSFKIVGDGDLAAFLLTVNNTANTINLAGNIKDNNLNGGSILKNGTGILELNGTNTYGGGTTLNNGTLVLGNNDALGTGGLTIDGATLRSNTALDDIPNNITVTAAGSIFSGTDSFEIKGTVNLGTFPLSVSNTSNIITLSGVVSGGVGGSIRRNGVGGTLLLKGANTYSGGTTLTSGTLIVGNATALGISSGNLAFAGGTLQSNSPITIGNTYSLTTGTSSIGGIDDLTLSGLGTLTAGRALTINNTAGTVTLSDINGAVGNTGRLIQNGSGGILSLPNANGYTGGTTVTAGTLLVGNATSLGTGTLTLNGGNLQSSSAVSFSNHYVLTAASVINGTQDLTLTGTGNLGANTLTVANTGGTVTLGGVVSGALGAILQNGVGGILRLSGNNTYGGGTTINAGTLRLNVSNALAATGAVAVNAGIFDINGTTQTIGNLTGAGNVTMGGGSLAFGTSTPSVTFDGMISGGGNLIKQNSGTVLLTGDITSNTTVNAGILYVNGTHDGPVDVNPGGTLGGFGTITGTVTNNGVVSPSDFSIPPPGIYGTLSIAGDYTITPIGITTARISPNGNTANIAVSGSAALQGALNVIADAPGDFVLGTTYTILSAGSLVGNFTSYPTTIGNIKTAIVVVTPADIDSPNHVHNLAAIQDPPPVLVELILAHVNLPLSASNQNEFAVGSYINDLSITVPGGDLSVTLGALGMLDPQQTANALESISPGRLNASTVVIADSAEFINKMTSYRLGALRNGTNEESYLVSAFNHTSKQHTNKFNRHNPSHQTLNLLTPKFYNATQYGARKTTHQHLMHSFCSVDECSDVWMNPFGRYSNSNSTNIDPSFNATTAGFALGADHKFCNNVIFGVGVGYYRAWIAMSVFPDRMRVNTAFATVYGTWFQDGYYLDASVVGGLTHYHSTHNIAYSGIRRTSTGTHRGSEIAPYVEFGRGYCINGMKVAPYISLNYIHIREQSYSLIGANSLDMNIQGKTANALYSEIGVRLSRTYALSDYLLTPEVALSFTNQRARNGNMVAGLIGLPGSFSVTNFSGNSHRISPAVGFLMKFYNGGFVKTYFSTEFGPRYQAYEFNIFAGISF